MAIRDELTGAILEAMEPGGYTWLAEKFADAVMPFVDDAQRRAEKAEESLREAREELGRARRMIASMNDGLSQEAFRDAWHKTDRDNIERELNDHHSRVVYRLSRTDAGLAAVRGSLQARFGHLDDVSPE